MLLTREHSRAKMAAGPVFSRGSMRQRHLRLLKLSVFLGFRWKFQPNSEAYSQPSLSESSGRCCGRFKKLADFPQHFLQLYFSPEKKRSKTEIRAKVTILLHRIFHYLCDQSTSWWSKEGITARKSYKLHQMRKADNFFNLNQLLFNFIPLTCFWYFSLFNILHFVFLN